ncbi:MAG: LarC family nickel insertion protein [Lachnospiraceae bacterium]|nr:LarC family nickel insertion protein [Lachnospiraceae bacterium]
MSRQLYLECYSGISGDMAVGAMLDLGADQQVLEQVLASLPMDGFTTKITTVQKSGINACDFDVILDEENHDHDMAWLFGSEAEEFRHDHDQFHDHEEHDHHHDHDHDYEGHDHEHHHDHDHHHVHRTMKEIREIIGAGQMTDGARSLALRIFEIIAQAEGQVHGKAPEEVHFHEVGAVDSIVDIVSFAVCFDNLAGSLGITDVIVPTLYEGTGTIRCQHGVIPVPVPAVTAIAVANKLRLHIMHEAGEFVTPTGAAIAAAVRTSAELPESFEVVKTGLGAGKREYKRAGVLRAMIIETEG